ncbi:Zinc finger BED domain-containing protein 4 [Frankliniella fusca]|uniref:Zinc finger BED domain-containing protein 4 n=1 Tax=Frankliniella fusca TaxID=407009 RepID=A0AAE1LM74_9NEOP|nr:Zinc finger BED domain-containing protein 4 [Frankliniella fusca]
MSHIYHFIHTSALAALASLSNTDNAFQVPSASKRKFVTTRRKRGIISGVQHEHIIPGDLAGEVDIKPKLRKTTDIIDIVTLSSDSESEEITSPQLQGKDIESPNDIECPVCQQFGKPKIGDKTGHKCALCATPVHAFGCSVPRGLGEEGYGGSDLLCKKCAVKSSLPSVTIPDICLFCRKNNVKGHQCLCPSCHLSVEPTNDMTTVIAICLKSGIGMSVAAFQDIFTQKVLSDEHITRASVLLKEQFSEEVDGLGCPLSISNGEKDQPVPVPTPDHCALPEPRTTSVKRRRTEEDLTEETPRKAPSSASTRTDSVAFLFVRQQSFQAKGRLADRVNEAVLFMIAHDMQPLSMVEDEGFLLLMRLIVPLYKVPSRQTFTRRLWEKNSALKIKYAEIFQGTSHFALTCDVWTHKHTMQSYLGMTGHYLGNMKLISCNVDIEPLTAPHDAAYLASVLLKVCQEWHISLEAVVGVVTDGGAKIKRAVKDAFGEAKHVTCLAHLVKNIPAKAVNETPSLSVMFVVRVLPMRPTSKGIKKVILFKDRVIFANIVTRNLTALTTYSGILQACIK